MGNGAIELLASKIKEELLKMPGVTLGRRFGGEAFFYRGRFFCHFHPAGRSFFLETFVRDKVDGVVARISGAIPHPEYGAYGWVRLPIRSERDLPMANGLIANTYRYLRTTKRIAVRKERVETGLLETARAKLPQVRFKAKEAKKTVQIILEVPETSDYDMAERLLEKATRLVR